jgi:hypothetical protein
MANTIDTTVKVKKLVVGVQTPDVTTGKTGGAKLTNTNTSYFNKDVSQLRASGNELEAIRQLARTNPDVSATVSAMVRIANSGLSYRVYDATHQLSPEGSTLLRSILNRLETQFDYTTGYDGRQSIAGVLETLLRGVVLTGSCAAELVLDKARLPYSLKPASTEKMQFVVSTKADGITQNLIPRYSSQKGNIDLDVPTFFYAALDFDPTTAYTYSPIEPAINSAIFHAEVVQDIRRSVERSGHSRLTVKINYEDIIKSAPAAVRGDADKLEAWVESVRQSVISEIEKLSPESAIVTFSNIETDYLNSQIGASGDYTGLVGIIDSILATALKVPQSVIGKGTGTQNTASTESLLFIQQAAGMQQPVETVLSRALTLACRLIGFEGYVVAKFNSIALRPKEELESFKMMAQTRILEQLSYGFISDSEAAAILGTGELSAGFKPLSGTQFLNNQTQDILKTNTDANPATKQSSTNKAPKSAGGNNKVKP